MEQCQDLASFTEQKGSMSSAASCAKPPAFCLLVGFQNIPCSSAAPSLLVPSKKLIYFLARAVRPAGTNTFSLLSNVSLQTRQRRETGIWSGKESTGWVSAIVHGWRRRVGGIDIYIFPCRLSTVDDGDICPTDTGSTGIRPPVYVFQDGLVHVQFPSRQQLEEAMAA